VGRHRFSVEAAAWTRRCRSRRAVARNGGNVGSGWCGAEPVFARRCLRVLRLPVSGATRARRPASWRRPRPSRWKTRVRADAL